MITHSGAIVTTPQRLHVGITGNEATAKGGWAWESLLTLQSAVLELH
jgi:hypothetical protein